MLADHHLVPEPSVQLVTEGFPSLEYRDWRPVTVRAVDGIIGFLYEIYKTLHNAHIMVIILITPYCCH